MTCDSPASHIDDCLIERCKELPVGEEREREECMTVQVLADPRALVLWLTPRVLLMEYFDTLGLDDHDALKVMGRSCSSEESSDTTAE